MKNGNIFTMAASNEQTTTELFSELGTLLGVAKRSDGKYHLADLCQAGSINRWAKNKPFRHSSENFDYNPASPATSNAARAEARKNANQGFDLTNAKISSTNDVSEIATRYNNTDSYNGWEYLRPRGRANGEPNRLRDFDGYNNDALPFFGGMTVATRHSKQDGNLNVAFTIVDDSSGKDLTHKDIPAITDSYIGAALVASNGTTYRMTHTDKIAGGGISVGFPLGNVPQGTYTVYPFLSSIKMGVTDGNVGNAAANVYTLPNVSGKVVVLSDENYTIQLSCVVILSTRIQYSIKITNNRSGSVTLTNNEMRVRKKGSSWDAIRIDGEQFVTDAPDASITIAAGGSYSKTGTITTPSTLDFFNNGCTLWVSIGGGVMKASKNNEQTLQPL